MTKIARMLLSFGLSFGFASHLPAQIGPFDQSSPDFKWKSLENEYVQVIYPDFMRPKAHEIAQLIAHYGESVGLSYGIEKPKRFPLILRPEQSDPNGFVTLMPRRSEWHAMSSYSPIVGSLAWYQSLAIHEYRHVIQQDFFNQDIVKFFYYFLGEAGVQIALAISNRPWYSEGDAVWSETVFSDAGRGRSPNFMARMKAIALEEETFPTYDQFLNGTYRRPLVNHYVYGYILVTAAEKRFGPNFWSRLMTEIAEFPHPFRFENSFQTLTGVRFQDFYAQTFDELRRAYKKGLPAAGPARPYSRVINAQEIGTTQYAVVSDLDTHATLARKEGDTWEPLAELPYHQELTRLDYSTQYAVQTEFRPHWRYGHKGSSRLVLIDLKSGEKTLVPTDERTYNPRFSASGQSIFVSQFKDSLHWQIVELNLKGQIQNMLRLPGWDLFEAVSLDADRILVLGADVTGRKALLIASFQSGLLTTILPPSRNNLFGLKSNAKGQVLFEAQIDGISQILMFDAGLSEFRRCSQSTIAAYTPAFTRDGVSFSEEMPYGIEAKQIAQGGCETVSQEKLISYRYLGDSPSDNYTGVAPVAFAEQEQLVEKDLDKAPDEDYHRFDRSAFVPHSWSFFAGRGLGLQLATNNYLNDFGAQVQLGYDADDNEPYTNAQIDFRTFAPVISLLVDARKRSADIELSDFELRWREHAYGLQLTLPYSRTSGVFSTQALIAHKVERLTVDRYRIEDTWIDKGSQKFVRNSTQLGLGVMKAMTFRAIQPSWGWSASAQHDIAQPDEGRSLLRSERTFAETRFLTPGLLANHGIKLTASGEWLDSELRGYRFMAPPHSYSDYVFARGYTYEPGLGFTKGTFDYVLPLAYPDASLGGWAHLKRIHLGLYYDTSDVDLGPKLERLDSTGFEIHAETTLFRFLPLQAGLRYIHRVNDDSDKGELFVATGLAPF